MATPHSHASRKIYVSGSRSDLRVPMREITLGGEQSPLRLYDTSGPYTDPSLDLDVKQGIPPLRLPWIHGRGDVEQLSGPSSTYRRQREEDPALGASARRPPGDSDALRAAR
jgi:phosphomethylpyrimidine synthase